MLDFYEKMLNTSHAVGVNILSDDKCCKLLALTFVFGGANEMITHNKKLFTDIKHAQKRLNIMDGETPNELMNTFKDYVKECCPNEYEDAIKPQWMIDLANEYNYRL